VSNPSKDKKLTTWFLANKLSLSLDKTCFSVFGIRDDNARCKVELKLGNVILKQVSCCKYLGIIITIILLSLNILITFITKSLD